MAIDMVSRAVESASREGRNRMSVVPLEASPPGAHDRLAMSPEAMRALGYRVVDLVVDHLAHIAEQPVGNKGDPATLRAALAETPPELPTALDEIFARLDRNVWPHMLNILHPRFFAFVPGPSNFVGVAADFLAAGYNVFNGSWLGGSGPAALELTVVEWIRSWCGMPASAGGLFVSGGSVANLTALLAARRAKLADNPAQAVVYCSDQTHSSIGRAVRAIGVPHDQIRTIRSDEGLRLPMPALAAEVERDRARGLRPFCVIANAGTTSTGAVDPLPAIAEFCRTQDLWMHIDGAYGAASVISQRGRAALRGLSEADSISLDPHKWLFQPVECGCVLVRDVTLLKSAFSTTAAYLADLHRDAKEVNLCDYGMQLTRSFRALKLWMSVHYFGLAAFRAAVDRGFALAELAERTIRAMPAWEIVTPAEMGIVTFRRRGAPEALYHALHDAMLAGGFAFLSSTALNGETLLRMCTINPRTTDRDVVETLTWLDALSSGLHPASPPPRLDVG
jgi:aromatic-L-amino-acid/L-tryptophan decarboxylase